MVCITAEGKLRRFPPRVPPEVAMRVGKRGAGLGL